MPKIAQGDLDPEDQGWYQKPNHHWRNRTVAKAVVWCQLGDWVLPQRFGETNREDPGEKRVDEASLRPLLERTYATHLAESGVSAPSLSYIMGWRGLQVADAYIQSSMKRAHQELRELALV